MVLRGETCFSMLPLATLVPSIGARQYAKSSWHAIYLLSVAQRCI